jgi:hypothetical protein
MVLGDFGTNLGRFLGRVWADFGLWADFGPTLGCFGGVGRAGRGEESQEYPTLQLLCPWSRVGHFGQTKFLSSERERERQENAESCFAVRLSDATI